MRSVSPLIALVALVALATLFQVGRVGASSAEAEAALQGGSSVPMQADQVDTLLEIANVWEDLRTMSPGAWIRENLETACNSFGAAYGVVCNDKGQVVQLWLTDPSATSGVLPDALGRLTELNLLSIGGVVLGDLPDSLATLTKLQVLQMPNSQLGGTFPSSWKHMMASLQLFEAHWAFVTGLRSWPSDLFSDSPTPPMQQWIMSGYHFGENQPIPHAFFQLPALQQLVLDDISFDGSIPPFFLDGASKASTEVQHSTTTQSTDKQGDHRDTDGDKTEDQKRLVADATRSTLSLAGDAFGSLGSSVLKRLRITGSSEMPTRLSSRRLPSSWAHLPTSLTSLTLHNLPWHGDFPAALPSRLEHLSLSNFPKLQGTVPSSIIDSPDLLTLDLRWLMSVHGDVPSPTKFETSALRSMTLHGVGFNGTLNASLLSSPSLAMLQISSLIYLPQQPLPSLPNGACPRLEHLELYVPISAFSALIHLTIWSNICSQPRLLLEYHVHPDPRRH